MDVSTADVVCLHLHAVERAHDGTGVPEELTLSGVSETLNVGSSVGDRVTLLEELETLAENGLIERVVQPVVGVGQERTAYRLTPSGRERATSVRERCRDETVTVTNGGTETVRLGDVDRYFDDRPLATALARLTEDGTVPLERFHGKDVVGRSAELERLETAVEALQMKGGQAVLVSGEEGVGKTTLVEEFLADRNETVITARGQCQRQGSRPYDVFRGLFDDLPDVAGIDRLLTGVPAVPSDEESLADQRQRVFADVGESLGGLAGDRQVVLLLEDLQWADEPSLELLQYLVETVGTLLYPVLFVGTYRTDEGGSALPTQLRAIVDEPRHEHIVLEPLDTRDLRHVLQSALGTDDVPRSVVEAIDEETGGNPLFAKEVAWLLEEQGAIDPATGTYPAAGAIRALPETLAGVANERLAGLDESAWSVLELGAVIGNRIPKEVLLAASASPEPDLLEYADLLVETGLWSRSEDHLRFVHSAVRETVLDDMPEHRRRTLHEVVAAAVEERLSGDATEQYDRLATHYRRAGTTDRAIRASLDAAERATNMYAHELAVDAAKQAIDLARSADVEGPLLEALEVLGETYLVTGESARARERFREVRERTDSQETTERALRREGLAAQREGEFAEARDLLQRGLAAAQSLSDRQAEAKNRQNLGSLAIKQGEFETARDSLRRSLEVFREVDDRENEAEALNELGVVARKEGDYRTALDHYRAAYDIYRDLGDSYKEAKGLTNLGVVASRVGDLEEATDHYERALEVYRDCGDRHRAAMVGQNLGIIAAKQGDFDAARENLQDALARLRDLGDRHHLARTRNNLGIVERKDGNEETAREHFHTALETFEALGDTHSEAKCRNNLGIIARRAGDTSSARSYHERSLELAREIGAAEPIAQSLGFLGAVDVREGDLERGRANLAEALDKLTDDDAVPVTLEIIRQHLETEVELNHRARAQDLCEMARTRIEGATVPLGDERARIEALCEDLRRE